MKLTDFLFAPKAKCAGCGSLMGADKDWLCADCHAKLHPLYLDRQSSSVICAHCGTVYYGGGFCTGCRRKNVRLLRAPAAYTYDETVRGIIHAFKFGGVYRMAKWMAGEMVKVLRAEEMTGFDLIIAVPLHYTRRFARGYNQSEKLARQVSLQTGINMGYLLKRTRATKQQSLLSDKQRRVNLDNAFAVTGDVKGKKILLIDDVRTTGTTAVKCTDTLFGAGAREVTVLTFAQAVPQDGTRKKYR